jgi:hypothetical protein
MNMLLLLPPEEQANFAEGEWIHFHENNTFNEAKLYVCEAQRPDKRLEDPMSWTTQSLGNMAYMSLNAPEKYQPRWKLALQRFLEDKLIRGKREIASYSLLGGASCNNRGPDDMPSPPRRRPQPAPATTTETPATTTETPATTTETPATTTETPATTMETPATTTETPVTVIDIDISS